MERNFLLDNIKFLLMICVIFGHLIEDVEDSNIHRIAYLFIYSFHMPAFIIISGMLSRPWKDSSDIKKMVRTTLIPFLLFSILYEAFYFAYYGQASEYISNFQPYWIMWFFLSLFIWRLLLPIIIKIRFSIFLLIILSLAVGYLDFIDRSFGISRTVYFFPFFIAGYKLGPNFIHKFNLGNIAKILPVLILLMIIGIFSYNNEISRNLFYGAKGYTYLEFNSALLRLGIYCISFITAMSVILLIPRKELFFSKMGENSIQSYIWHPLFITVMFETGISPMISTMPDNLSLLISLSIAIFLTVFLSTRFVASTTERFIFSPATRLLSFLKIV